MTTLRTNYNDGGATPSTSNVTASDMNGISSQVNANTAIVAGPALYNVMGYGATGNGSTDDTSAIQSAITAMGTAGGTLYFPAGTYIVSNTLAIPQNTTVLGAGRGGQGITGGTIIQRKTGTSNVLMSCNGTATGPGTHTYDIRVSNLSLFGNNTAGALLQMYYGSKCYFDNLWIAFNTDVGVDIVESYDCYFSNVFFEGNGSTTQPAVHIRNSAASSGFGSSTDQSNMIWFTQCHWESFVNGAVKIEAGTSNTHNPNGFYFTDCKMETAYVNGDFFTWDTYTLNVQISHLYMSADSFNTGYSTPVNAINAVGGLYSIRDVWISNPNGTALFANGLNLQASGAIENVIYDGTAPTNGVVYFNGLSRCEIGSCYITGAGTLFAGTQPATLLGFRPMQQVAGAVTDGGFPSAPPNGTLGFDTTNTRLYARIGGSWLSQPFGNRTGTTASSATPSINTDAVSFYNITALAVAITSMTTNLTGSPGDSQELKIRIKDNGSARAITWGTSFASSGNATLLATTVAGKTHEITLRYNATTSKWVCIYCDATGY